jgi:hypothetical protein
MPTEKHGLNLPEKGTTDWNIPLNENFEKLDSAALLQVYDVETLKADYTPSDTTLAFVESKKEFWSGTGTKWVKVAQLSPHTPDVYVQSSEPASASEGDVWIQP